MSVYDNDKTIAAIATPLGMGAIAIVRMSGNEVIKIVKRIFYRSEQVEKFVPRKVYLGRIVENRTAIDEVFVTFFKKPKSYTKEDMIEISCHGGIYIAQRILELILKNGARLAEPGEFTKRAFLNGRIDLSQAEAVAEIIQAKTERSLQISIQKAKGVLYKKINILCESMINAISLLEIELDFSEEDIKFLDRNELIKRLINLQEELELLISSFKEGRIISEGVKLVIVGKRNVGKSSIFNVLLNEERAIITNIPGTTRDLLEDELNIKGMLFNIIDTAGIGKTEDFIEQEGINRTLQEIENADIILHILDGSELITREDEEIRNILDNKIKEKATKIIAVINKIDLNKKIQIEKLYNQKNKIPIIEVSAKHAIGFDILQDALSSSIIYNNKYDFKVDCSDRIIITQIRHLNVLEKAYKSIYRAMDSAKHKVPSEFVIVDLKDALNNLGEIIGITTSEDILNNIFNKFCIGK